MQSGRFYIKEEACQAYPEIRAELWDHLRHPSDWGGSYYELPTICAELIQMARENKSSAEQLHYAAQYVAHADTHPKDRWSAPPPALAITKRWICLVLALNQSPLDLNKNYIEIKLIAEALGMPYAHCIWVIAALDHQAYFESAPIEWLCSRSFQDTVETAIERMGMFPLHEHNAFEHAVVKAMLLVSDFPNILPHYLAQLKKERSHYAYLFCQVNEMHKSHYPLWRNEHLEKAIQLITIDDVFEDIFWTNYVVFKSVFCKIMNLSGQQQQTPAEQSCVLMDEEVVDNYLFIVYLLHAIQQNNCFAMFDTLKRKLSERIAIKKALNYDAIDNDLDRLFYHLIMRAMRYFHSTILVGLILSWAEEVLSREGLKKLLQHDNHVLFRFALNNLPDTVGSYLAANYLFLAELLLDTHFLACLRNPSLLKADRETLLRQARSAPFSIMSEHLTTARLLQALPPSRQASIPTADEEVYTDPNKAEPSHGLEPLADDNELLRTGEGQLTRPNVSAGGARF
jgi:hypothetical protein